MTLGYGRTGLLAFCVVCATSVAIGDAARAQVNGSGSSSPAGLGAPGSNQGGISPGNPAGTTSGSPTRDENLGDASRRGGNAAGPSGTDGALHLPSGQNPGATSTTGTTSPAGPSEGTTR